MAKIIKFKPRVTPLRAAARQPKDACPRCHHGMDVHVTHPNGAKSCAARGCECRTPAPA